MGGKAKTRECVSRVIVRFDFVFASIRHYIYTASQIRDADSPPTEELLFHSATLPPRSAVGGTINSIQRAVP
jgi:hypothetical protein